MESLPVVYVNIAGGGGVGRQPLSRKSRVREFMLALRPFNLRMQALRRPRTSLRHNRYTKHIFQGVISS